MSQSVAGRPVKVGPRKTRAVSPPFLPASRVDSRLDALLMERFNSDDLINRFHALSLSLQVPGFANRIKHDPRFSTSLLPDELYNDVFV